MSEPTVSVPIRFSDYIKEMKESGSVLVWIWNELVSRDGKKYLVRMLGAMVLATLVGSLQPVIFSKIINHVVRKNVPGLIFFMGSLAVVVALYLGAQLLQEVLRERVWSRTIATMQRRINELFYEKSLGQHSDEGATLNYTTVDRGKSRVEAIQQMLLFESGGMIVQVIFTYLLIWTIGWWVGVVATCLVVLHLAWSLYLNYHVSRETESIERDFRSQNRQVNERWEKIVRVKTSGKALKEHHRLFTWLDEILERDYVFWTWLIRQAKIRDLVVHIARVLVIGYGVYLVYNGDWQVGTLIPPFAWMTDLSQNLGWIGNAERRINQQVPKIKAMRNALMSKPSFIESEGLALQHNEPVRIAFKNVGLTYDAGTDKPQHILHGITFTINPGEKVALIGPSGAGKTSIMRLLLRYMDPTSGKILINGSRLPDVELASWMDRVGYIPQEPQVFDGTIRYNLTFGLTEERRHTITDEEIWRVMRLLQIDFGARLTNGLDTLVGKDGMKLSGGEKQRLIIGAAVIKNPWFMIIDEATSALDSTTERMVQEGLQQVLHGPIGALIVAHRLSTVRYMCNRFMVLTPANDTTGTPQIEAVANSFEELYRLSPTFRKLADDQHIHIAEQCA